MTNSISKPPITCEQLWAVLKEKAEPLASHLDPLENNAAWTLAIKILEELASKYDCDPYPCKEPRRSEFMLDFVWWGKKNQGALIGVESEWGNPWDFRSGNVDRIVAAVEDDFWKLLCFKAPLKVLIYTAKDREMRLAIHKQILKDLAGFEDHVEGECYLFVEFSQPSKCFRYKHPVLQSGRCARPPTLEPMDLESARAITSE